MITIKSLNTPIILTLIRLVFSPLLLPVLLVFLLPFNIFYLNGCLTILFICFGLTDFFDGYLARKYNQETSIGKMLDPIADKFLLYSTLIALLAAGKIFYYWVIILIGREFFVMGLRMLSLENNFAIAVSFWGKSKTSMQTVCLAWIILNPYQSLGFKQAFWWNGIQAVLLFFAIVSSVVSAWFYYQIFVSHFKWNRTI